MPKYGIDPLNAAISDASNNIGLGLSRGSVNPTAPAQPADAPTQAPTIDARVQEMNTKEPGRFKAMTPDEFKSWHDKQDNSDGWFSEFAKGAQSGLISNATMAGNFAQALSQITDSPWLYQKGKDLEAAGNAGTEGLDAKVPSYTKVHGPGDLWNYLQYQAGSMLGTSVPALGAGLLTTLVTENPILGLAGGAAGPSYVQNTGDLYGMLRDSPGVADAVKAGKITPKGIAEAAMVGGVPMAALDVAGDIPALGIVPKGIARKLKNSIVKRIIGGVATGMISEGSTEGLQQVIEEGVADAIGDKSPMTQRVVRVIDSAIAGVVGGGVLGGPAHVVKGVSDARSPAVKLHKAATAAAQVEQTAQPAAAEAPPVMREPGPPPPRAAEPMPGAGDPIEKPSTGPIGRAAERGRAHKTAQEAAKMVPPGTPVEVSVPGVPPMQVTIHAYHADGVDVRDANGELNTLPMDDPDVAITPVEPQAHAEPILEAEPAGPEASPAEEPAAAPAPPAAEPSPAPEPVKQPVNEAEKKPAAKAEPKKKVEASHTPLNANISGSNVAFQDETHAALYKLGRARQSLRNNGRNTADADKLLQADREKIADALKMPVDEVNQAADAYRHDVEKVAKEAGGKQIAAPIVKADEAAEQWDALPIDQRKAIFDKAKVAWSPKLQWKSLSKPIQSKVRLAMAEAPATVDQGAHEAATSPQNDLAEPTDAQKKAGNYKVGPAKVGSLELSIENPEGSTRSGTDANGKAWSIKMKSHYGYIKGTKGYDKDHLDINLKPGTPEDLPADAPVYVVDQNKGNGHFDEHKPMVGYGSEAEARKAYLSNYAKGWEKNIRGITEMPFGEFETWAKSDGPNNGALVERHSPAAAEPNPAPKKAPARGKSDWTEIGKNEIGQTLYEDQRGVRSYIENGVRHTEPVSMVPTRSGVKPVVERVEGKFSDHPATKPYMTVEEIAARADGKAATEPDRTPEAPGRPAYGANNKLVTAERADEIRKKLRAKLKNQVNAGIDPEVLAMGTELAAFHIEAGARQFADVTRAIARDLGVKVADIRKFARAWYNGARDLLEDSGHDVAGMDSPETVKAQAPVLGEESGHEPEQLDQRRQEALAGVSAEPVQGDAGERGSGTGVEGRGGADVSRDERTGSERNDQSGSLGGREGAVSVPARGGERAESERQPALQPERAGDRGRSHEGDEHGSTQRSNSAAADRLESDVANSKPAPESAAKPAREIPGNLVITDADAIGEGGQRTKFNDNLAAIRLLKKIESEDRSATRDEQRQLAKYVGWGGLSAAFPREDGSIAKGWEKAAAELKGLLTEAEYKAAASSTRNAHYTSPEVVKEMWRAVRRLGYAGGRMLEPAMGTGNFLGLMPGEARNGSQITGVELDRITGGIAKQLYPDANIQTPVGFQEFETPDGYFDLAIGNPPFGSERVFDKNRKHLNFSVHNFFFAKSLDALRPGGVLAMVVSNYAMDAHNAKAREYMAARADLLGAIRLPNNAFSKNAGTEVTTDIVFLRKRGEGEAPAGEAWMKVRPYKDAEGRDVPLNEYFHDHPENMLGEFGAYGEMYRGASAALIQEEGQDTAKLLREAINRLPEGIIEPSGEAVAEPIPEVPREAAEAAVGSAFLDDKGLLWMRGPDHLGRPQATPAEFPNEKAMERVSGMIRLRDAFARLRAAQLDPAATEKQVENLRGRLNKVYDGFAAKNGPVNLDANKRLFIDDPTWPQISALEDSFDKGISALVAKNTGETSRAPSAKKAAVFRERTQFPYQRPTKTESAKDALALSQNELGRLDLDYMAQIYGRTRDAIVEELGDLIFKNPEAGYETRDSYLSGNVKRKLALAIEAAKTDPKYKRNVAVLRETIPADLNPDDINIAPGVHWVPRQHVAAFVDHITESKGSSAVYTPLNAKWSITPANVAAAALTRWGTGRASVRQVIEAALHGQTITIRDRDADGNQKVNHPETDAANEKVNRVAEEWRRWIWRDDARRKELAALYNDSFNTDRLRQFDGSHLTLPGKVSDDIIKLRPHQLNFIWRVLQSSTALADHVVGAGKTFALVASIMEMRRTGLARKPMLTVPNHLVEQWAADFIRLYPGARILAATKKDFEASNRKRLFARVATGDYDAVIVAHSSFGKIPVDPEFHKRFIDQHIADIEVSLKALREAEGSKSRSVKQLEKWRDNQKEKLKRLLDTAGKDDGLTFQDIGVDALFVDEAHEFKNLGFSTSMQRVAGLGNPTGSQKAADLYMKVQIVLEKTGGRNIVFATGTPISNTMAEMFTIQRYLAGRELKNLGTAHFDAWARMSGKVVTDWELSPSGTYKLKSRFARFVNTPELLKQYRTFADVITNDDINRQLAAQGRTLGIPKMVGGKPQIAVVERSQDQAVYIGLPIKDKDGNDTDRYPEGSLIHRAENLPPDPRDDNMLKIMSDARKAALDMRLIDPSYPENPGSKINDASGNLKRIYDQWHDHKGTQLVFIDLSTPKAAKGREINALRALIKAADDGDEAAQEKLDAMSPDEFEALNSKFSVYDELREKLIGNGIRPSEISFIHDANTDKQKADLFAKVRSGQVRVLFGSTAKMGAGMNVQERLVALHHIDAPWRPSDLEQRDGRILRQGNVLYAADPEGFEVGVYRYATKNTLDARMWQTIEGKALFIEQLRKGDLTLREVEDIAGEAVNAAEMKAAASGNPLILEEMDLRQQVRKLDGQKSAHDREQFSVKMRIEHYEHEIERLRTAEPRVRQDAEKAAAIPAGFKMELGDKTYEKPKEAGARILLIAAQMKKDGEDQREIGTFGGFKLFLEHVHTNDFVIELGAEHPMQVDLGSIDVADPTGTAQRISNTVRKLVERPEVVARKIKSAEQELPGLREQLGPWDKDSELEQAKDRHRQVLDALKPKKKEAAQKPADGEQEGAPEQEAQSSPVARLTPRAQQVRSDLHDAVVAAVERVAGRDAAQRTATPSEIDNKTIGSDWNAAPGAGNVAGLYHPSRDANGVFPLIEVALASNPDSVRTGYHEGWHAIEGTLTEQEVGILRRETPKLREFLIGRLPDIADILRHAAPEEIWAESAAVYTALRDREAPAQGINAHVRRIFNRIRRMLEAIRNAVHGLGFQTVDDVFENFGKGEMAARREEMPAGLRQRWWSQAASAQGSIGARMAVDGTGAGRRGPRSAKELADMVKGLGEDARQHALGLLPLNTLVDWAAPDQKAIGQYIELKRHMDAFRHGKQVAADGLVQKWRKVIGRGGKSSKVLADVKHESTLAGIDPSLTDSETRAKPGYAELRGKWDRLSPAARALYAEVRDAYKAQAKELDDILLENIGKAMDQQIIDAERHHQEELDHIRDVGMEGQDRADAIAAADRKLNRAVNKLKFGKKARMAALRQSFEQNRVPEPYFPLARFGQYFATVRDAEGKVLSFSRRESKAALDRLAADLRRAYPDEKIETGVLSNKQEVRDGMDPRLMADVASILGGANVSDEVMDQIWQRYLETMPDLSIRKRFIHRRGVPGFHEDALRSFASHMFHASHQMAKVKYGGDLAELVNQATDQAKGAPDTIAAMKVANELRLRQEWVMNPTNSAWATNATALGFIYYLGMSPASAMVNLSQTVLLGVPILGSRFGMARATGALGGALRDFTAGKGSVENAKLTQGEKTAMDELYARGVIDRSMAHDLSGVGEHGAAYNPTRTRVMRVISFLFHHAERLNREVTALATYRLARKAGVGHAEAIDTAADLTWKTHFDYSNTNRPRFMQSDAAKVLFLFKNFQTNMLYRLFRDTHQAFKGATPAARREARLQLAGIMGMLGLMTGALGVPLMKQLIIPMYGAIFGDPDDEKSAKEEFRDDILNTLGPQLGGMALDGVPGYLAGVSLTRRIGMGDLWFQDDDRVQNSEDWWNSVTNDILGPVWGMAHNAYRGFNVIRDGKGTARGLEIMAPTAVRNIVRSWRYAQEGVVNLRGDQVVPQSEIGLTNAAKQALGFTPAVVAEQYDRNTEKVNMNKRIAAKRRGLLDDFVKALEAGDEEAKTAALEEIKKFNEVPLHAARRITAQSIRRSLRTRARLSNRAENGVIIQNKQFNYLLNKELPPRVY